MMQKLCRKICSNAPCCHQMKPKDKDPIPKTAIPLDFRTRVSYQ